VDDDEQTGCGIFAIVGLALIGLFIKVGWQGWHPDSWTRHRVFAVVVVVGVIWGALQVPREWQLAIGATLVLAAGWYVHTHW